MKTHNVEEMLRKEMKRCLGLLSRYAAQGGSGLHGHNTVSQHIIVANAAIIAQDLPQMTISLKTLEGLQID